MKKMDLHQIRKDYNLGSLDETIIPDHPLTLFSIWMGEALNNPAVEEPTAMAVSTVSELNKPSTRIVLLKEFSENGFVFFTHYTSRKGQNIDKNQAVSLLFFWPVLQKQIRIEGNAEKISTLESDKYFNSRPSESQISAIISQQSKVLSNKEEMTVRFLELSEQNNDHLKRPENWGGYIVNPEYFEFWQGGSHRLHDRITYHFQNGLWNQSRLWP